MSLLLITGHPSSGKSTIVARIVEYFKEKDERAVVVVSDDQYAAFSRLQYGDSTKEKEERAHLRSEMQRVLGRKNVVIVDSLNYIKGFRYELFLEAKLRKTTYAVVQVRCRQEVSLWLNSLKASSLRYEEPQIEALRQRYEIPDSRQRWDSPLFEVDVGRIENEVSASTDLEEDLDHPSPRFVNLPLEELYAVLYEGAPLIENKSTRTAPIAPTNYLHLLDRITSEIVESVIEQQKTSLSGQEFVVPHAKEGQNKVLFSRIRSLAEFTRLRRHFISTTKKAANESRPEELASAFVRALNVDVSS